MKLNNLESDLIVQNVGETMEKIMSLMGLAVFIGVAWLLSVDRKNVQWKPVLWGVGLQIIIAVVVLHPTMQQFFFEAINQSVLRLLSFSEGGCPFCFWNHGTPWSLNRMRKEIWKVPLWLEQLHQR